ncbi:G patch domain and ankyrin repeat-containing protein 1 G5 protein HLA-B-associated transcript 4 [Triplophysa tibetana]|uniref:G patch domain and ankyrin repeat-containing protein 1 G5 protein HLA-B-associated transcript 4 n=1 Tax=Triplophysa tibetana TaxID=1572043 RepID=A0A5A9PMW6_9TELE|nr:G patch domain and ankyrin repeat-containing protein 1 G5 protein HLA-B-associated transcript 4 [Triplophysa tibetana]
MSYPAIRNPMYFTKAKEEEKLWIEGKKKEDIQSLTGQEAKDFYQSLLQESSEGRPREACDATTRRRKRGAGQNRRSGARRRSESDRVRTGGTPERNGHKLLQYAQEGNIQGLRDLLQHGCDVNFRDDFFWTGVMCAGQAGKTEAVRLLLQHGAAWVGVVDKKGRDARDLAVQAGHHDVVRELEQFGVSETSPIANGTNSIHSQWCSVCAVHYTDSTQTHNRSTLHQFSELRPPTTPQYCLPSTSNSFKMMLHLGWDPSSGLGPSHSGRKNPVSTVLKRDQTGFGYGRTPQPKVTHFQARDPHAVQHKPTEKRIRQERGSKLNINELKRKEERDKIWERDFRSSFNFDL